MKKEVGYNLYNINKVTYKYTTESEQYVRSVVIQICYSVLASFYHTFPW